jgi:hypothetical protein
LDRGVELVEPPEEALQVEPVAVALRGLLIRFQRIDDDGSLVPLKGVERAIDLKASAVGVLEQSGEDEGLDHLRGEVSARRIGDPARLKRDGFLLAEQEPHSVSAGAFTVCAASLQQGMGEREDRDERRQQRAERF